MKNLQTYFILTLIMVTWGLNVSIIKILVSYFPPVTITSLRIMAAGLSVFIILGVMGKVRKPSFREMIFIVFGGLLSVVSHHLLLAIGLTETSAVNGGLILGAGPLLTAILSSVLLRNKPTGIQVLGFLLGGAGVTFIVLSGNRGVSNLSHGDFYVFLSILSQALSFIVISKATKTLDPRLLTGYMLVFGGVILFVLGNFMEPGGVKGMSEAPLSVWAAFAVSAVVATAVGHMVYNTAISKIGPAEASIFLNLNTFFSLAGSALILGEVITVNHMLGLILIVAGVLFGSGALEELVIRQRRKRHSHHM
ncbi:DMT family transporter [Bacillus sp. ISL-47]|uniref:DMT family transporter n=1 Tax=Bacillus sp. ISL-47 TaxID=2819130 RepID=UPI001BE50727|nr:DMT family transporter [Bacillus sp. ISL-47]MBT2709086.1 DMT family transporter [Pseudomonas sp. ISL-84]